jgi:cytosine/adenosine deaminase-related metal-dependent hydrolase
MFESLIQLAEAEQVPLCMHLAETRAEMEFLQHGTGELRDMLTRIGLWRDGLHPIERRPIDFLQRLSALKRALIAHGNYLEPSDWKFLAKHPQVSVVYCPRTHHYFGHSPHPWREMLAAGASVALGTDGRSSNPDYSLWQEVLWLDELTAGRERPLLLELATLRGARALGLEAEMGSLTVGKAAEFCAVSLQTGTEADPFVSVFGS